MKSILLLLITATFALADIEKANAFAQHYMSLYNNKEGDKIFNELMYQVNVSEKILAMCKSHTSRFGSYTISNPKVTPPSDEIIKQWSEGKDYGGKFGVLKLNLEPKYTITFTSGEHNEHSETITIGLVNGEYKVAVLSN